MYVSFYNNPVLFNQGKVQLLFLEVGACHLDGDSVTEAVRAFLPSSAQAIVLFIEFVVIIIEVADRYHSLTFILVQLNVQSPFGNAGNNTVVSLSQTFRHVFHLFVLDRGAFRIGGYLLHAAGMFAERFVFLLGNASSA